MASSSENQGLQIAVIIFALLTIIMSGATFYVFKLSEDAELRAAEANRKSNEADAALRTALEEMEEYRKMLGTKFAALQNPKLEDVKQLFDADIAVYANTFPEEKRYYADALAELKTAYDTLNSDLLKERQALADLTKQVETETSNKKQQIETHRTAAETAQDQAKDAIAKLDEERKKLNSEKDELLQQVAAERAATEAIKAEMAALDKKTSTEITSLKNLNTDKQKKLDELTNKTFAVADGEIRWVSPSTRSVWINVGRDDGLRKSITFSVYGVDQNGVARSEPKASIEVTQVLGAHRAEATIIEDNISDPILIGDKIYTPLWHKGRHEQFAILGLVDVDGDGNSDVNFLKDLIRRSGGEVVAELMPDGSVKSTGAGMTINTRYLITGEAFPNTSEEYGKMLGDAEQLGIEQLSVQKFLDYVGWADTSKVVQFGKDAKPEDFMFDPNADRARRPAPSSAGANGFRRRRPPQTTGGTAY